MTVLTTDAGAEIRPLALADHPALKAINAEPSVELRWPVRDGVESWLDDEGPMFTIIVDGEIAGLVQYSEENEPDYRHASMDIFLSEGVQGRGAGTDVLRRLARYLFEELGHHRIEIDPAADNVAAIRCYEKVGFKRVGILRRAERDFDGRGWHDALMMDLLAEQLT